jgi:hypothetical protein
MVDYALVLTYHPDFVGCLWGLSNNDYSTLVWDDGNDVPVPSQGDLDAAWPSVRDALGWKAVRGERDGLLAGCDWTQVADAPLTAGEREAWADYRQALRDVPQTFDSPDDVVWPEAP